MSLKDLISRSVAGKPIASRQDVTPAQAIGLTDTAIPEDAIIHDDRVRFGQAPIGFSEDLARIVALPRRHIDPETMPDVTELMKLSKPGPKTRKPLPLQAHAALEIMKCQGALLPMAVGSGKTWITMIAPMLIPCRMAVLFIPPDMREAFDREWNAENERWLLPSRGAASGKWLHKDGRPVLWVFAYSELSHAKFTGRLAEIQPDLIIADEAHLLKNSQAVRTKRFCRYMDTANARFIALSGTFTSKSIKDYAHLAKYALRDGSPLPLHYPVVEEWATAIDENTNRIPAPIGQLRKLCRVGETARQGFRRRLIETPGVVVSTEGSVQNSLVFVERKPPPVVPPEIDRLIQNVRDTATRPDGEQFIEQLQVSNCLRQLASGFYYKWIFPRGETREQIDAWRLARKNWHREIREKLSTARDGMDSPLLLARAAIRWHDGYKWKDPSGQTHLESAQSKRGPHPVWESEYWIDWREIRDTVQPETECVWLDDFLAANAADWARENRGLIWVDHQAFGARVSDLAGVPYYAGGIDDSAGILAESGVRSVVASIHAHRRGKNLQKAFSVNLFPHPPVTSEPWEQAIGRTHRQGQEADTVYVFVYRHTPEMCEALTRSRDNAKYIQESMGARQKLLQATYEFNPEAL